MVANYWFNIDWSNNGTWTNTGEDVTARVLAEAQITYGRDQARALSPVANGSAGFELDNRTRDYSPENTSSPLNGLILPARPVRIQVATQLLNSNPDFELTDSPWDPFGSSTFTRSTNFARVGSYAGRLVTDAGSDPRVESELCPVTVGVTYQYSGYMYSPIAVPTQVTVGINWFDAAFNYISTSQVAGTLSAGTWLNVTGSGAAPVSSAYGQIKYGFQGTPGAGIILYGDLIQMTTNPVTIFRGHLDEYTLLPARNERKVTISCLDPLAQLTESKATTDLYPSIRTGDAIHKILDSISWSGVLRDIDTGATTLRWWSVNAVDAWSAIQDILAAEGSPALITSDSSGSIVFRDRHHRLIRTASTTSQVTLRDTGSEPKFSEPLMYDQGWRDVVNDVLFEVDERGPAPDRSVIWESDLVYNVGASATLSFTISTEDPFYDAAVLTSTVISGSATVSINVTQGQSTTISIVAGGGGAQVTNIQLDGYVVGVQRTLQVSASDATSISLYGSKSGPDGAGAASYADAEAIAALAVLYRKTRLPIVQLDVRGSNATRLTQCITRNLSDRITIVDAETGLNRAFFIEQINHQVIDAGALHTTTFGCEAVPTTSGLDDPSTVFIFNHANNGKFGTGKFGT